MANILSQNAVSVTSGAASVTLTAAQAPTGSMIVVCYTHATVLPGSTSISGFTLLDQAQSSSSSVFLNDATYYRIATTDGITITTSETDANIKFLECFVITGHDGLVPLFSHGGSGNTTTSGNPTAASLNADKANDVLLGFGSTNAAKTTSINGMTPTNGSGPSDRGSYRSVRFSQTYTTPGATGVKTLTVTSPTSPQRANIMLVLVGDPGQVNVSATDTATNTDTATVVATTSVNDSAIETDTATINASATITDTGFHTDTTSLSVQASLSDTGTHTDSVSIFQATFVDTFDSITSTDIANIAASLAINEIANGLDQATINAILTVSDTIVSTDTATINVITTDSFTNTDTTTITSSNPVIDAIISTDTSTVSATVVATDSGVHNDTTTITNSLSTNDSATHIDSVSINVIISDSATHTDQTNISASIIALDTITATDVIPRLRTGDIIREDQITYPRPIFIKPAKPFRIIAQDVFTREFFDWDVPLVNPELTFRNTAPNSFKGELRGDIRYLTDINSKFIEDRVFLHCEEDGIIRQSTILMPFIDSNGEQNRQIEGIGFSDMPNRRYYLGVPIYLIEVDPMTVVRYIWGYCLVGQNIQDFIDIRIPSNVTTPVKIGTPFQNVNFQTNAGQNVSFEAGPYELNYWEVTNLGTELNKLYKETPIEYTEQTIWTPKHDDIVLTMNYGYPRIGAARSASFRGGENVIKYVPEYTSNRYPRSVTVIGAGEGPTAIRCTCAFVSGDIKRVPYDIILENEEIQSGARAFAIAKFELLRQYRSRYSIKSIVVDTTHPNAKLGTWGEGDDIFYEDYVRNVGRVADWQRINEYTYYPDSKIAELQIAPSASFPYGATKEVIQ